MKSTGEILKELRGELSMEQLAEILNKNYSLSINKGMISRWENNKTSPDNIYLTAYAKYFDIDLNYIVGLTKVKKSLRNSLGQNEIDERIANLNTEELSELDKILNETALFFNNEKVSREDKDKLRRALTEIFFDSLATNKEKEKK